MSSIQNVDEINYDPDSVRNAMSCLNNMKTLEDDTDFGMIEEQSLSSRYDIEKYVDKIDSKVYTSEAISVLKTTMKWLDDSFTFGLFDDELSIDDYGDFLNDGTSEISDEEIKDLLRLYGPEGKGTDEQPLTKLPFYGSVASEYDYVDENGNIVSGLDFIKSNLDEISNLSDARNRVVMAAYYFLKIHADKGKVCDYEQKGNAVSDGKKKFNTTEDVLTGTNCNGFLSWTISFANSSLLEPWYNTQDFWSKVGDPVDKIDNVQSGDIFAVKAPSNVSGFHVGLVLMNDVENQIIVTAEAVDGKTGIIPKKRTYEEILNYSDNWLFKDMTEYYLD